MYQMAKSLNQRKRPKKRGPKEERLIITDDPITALKKLLRPQLQISMTDLDTNRPVLWARGLATVPAEAWRLHRAPGDGRAAVRVRPPSGAGSRREVHPSGPAASGDT